MTFDEAKQKHRDILQVSPESYLIKEIKKAIRKRGISF